MEQPNIHLAHYPDYNRVQQFLSIIHGQSYLTFRHMNNIIWENRGTPQNTRDWTNPNGWIPNILTGQEQKLAYFLWDESAGNINPRHATDLWRFCHVYDLVEVNSLDVIARSRGGEDVLQNLSGSAIRNIDYLEGLFHLLAIVAEHGPGKRSDLLPHFANFLELHSGFKSNATIGTAWYHRMVNLTNRGLLEYESGAYRISQSGLDYLGTADVFFKGTKSDSSENTLQDIRKLVNEHKDLVRQKIADTLATMNPYQFEVLIQRLLEAMGYKDVEVTNPSNDGGVDVVANIQVGITRVREVVQVKRHKGSIGRPVLDQLRGSLHRFGANRGTIISTGKFTKGTHEAAFEFGAAPIMLIDGETLVSLLIENEIGARMDTVKILKYEATDFLLEEENQRL